VSEPADLELSLRRKDATRYAVDLVYSQPGSEVDVRPLGNRAWAVSFDEVELRSLSADPDGYGRALGRMLFADEALAIAVAEARATAQSQQRALRLRLSIAPDTPEIHALRWETLRISGDKLPLALSEQVLLTRALASADWRPVTLRAKGDLRAMVVIAAPAGLERFNLVPINAAVEQERARASLASLPMETLANPGQATLPSIAAKLRDGYDILYLVAHGAFVDDEPWLFLDNGQGAVARVSGADLVARLADLPARPRLVLLASCEGAGDGSREVLAALGPRLAAAGIPAVIAMQGSFAMATNAAFAPTFFRELQRDGRIDRALAAARQAVADRPDWWAPVLFTRLRSGRIWYESGFDEQDFQRWPALLRSLSSGKCTPILGPGLLEPITGSTRDLAQRLAETYNFPLAPFDRDDLPQVAQYLAVNQSVAFMRDEVERELRALLSKRVPTAVAGLPPDVPLSKLLSTAGAQRRATDPVEPHQVLAALPVPIYLTANPDNLLVDALYAAQPQRKPQVMICPWYAEELHFTGAAIEPPAPATPLVYHLLGHLDNSDSLVISEDDYFRYLIGVKRNVELIPDSVQRALADTALLFLGFRFEDWSFRALLQSVLRLSGGDRRKKYAHVAVQIDPQEGATLNPEAARKYLKDYLGPAAAQTYQANISVYWGSVDDFIRELHMRWQAEQPRPAPSLAREVPR
jgi:hypothetical protein